MTPPGRQADRPSPLAEQFGMGLRIEAKFADEHGGDYTAEQWRSRADFLDGEIDEVHAEIAALRAKVTELCGRRLVASIRARVTKEDQERGG